MCKIGDRFAALEPIRQGVRKHFGAFGQNVARGLALRMDNGPQYIAVDFRNEIHYPGISLSAAFVDEPECNGIAEQFIGLLKEQCVSGGTGFKLWKRHGRGLGYSSLATTKNGSSNASVSAHPWRQGLTCKPRSCYANCVSKKPGPRHHPLS